MEMMTVIMMLVVISMTVVVTMLTVVTVVTVMMVTGDSVGGGAYSRDNVQTAEVIVTVTITAV